MRFIPISRAKAGMVLSKTIFDSEHRILLGAYMALTEEFISRLKERGFPGFYIEDDLTKDIIINEAISEELRGQAVSALVRNDIDATLDAVQQIVEQLRNSNIISLDLIDLRSFDEYTYRHSVNVAVLSTIVGIGMNLNNQTLVELCTAAILHDLGKLRIDNSILNKPGTLTDEEYATMKTHSQLSYELIKDKPEITARTKAAVLFHHENMDGSGYPKGLKGEDIHLLARIIHVVDVYDALTTARPYKSAYSPLESTEYLMSGSGIMFDGDVVRTFIKYVPVYPKGVSVILSNGEEAVVLENHMEDMLHPIVRTLSGQEIDLAAQTVGKKLSIIRAIDNDLDPQSRAARRKKKHILIIDDMIVNLRAMEGILRDKYKVSVAKNVQQAVKFMYRRRPDLIILDIDMPEIDGLEAVKLIAQDIDSSIPFVFVTALAGRETVRKAREAGARDYILKPYKPLYLLDRVSRVLGDGTIVM